ncbi:hypothetical protein J3D55_004128 [Chryseobacterium ginsenosidimutans]|uniref:hypothetical protein n=1 Tax=Chryseobacterium ginsenosidimutans TaxID=687846 RepID=UPI0021687069|nr:hypothetical protein [Chryseobacterium ginsenosidimutans]MCS3871212.1 hypothetical protein [Chryseobacterium ginsenosidimutans]
MNTFNREQYDVAIADWTNCRGNYAAIKNLILTNYVFNFDSEQIDWMKNANKNTEFCTEIGIYQDQLVAILCPLDPSGQKVVVDNYPYSVLSELDRDLNLVETEVYTVVKNAVLSRETKNG